MKKPFGLIFFSLIMGVIGQFLFKYGLNQLGDIKTGLSFLKVLLSPYIIIGIFSYVIATASWLAILSKTELSFAYPLISLSYIMVLLLGIFFLKEHVNLFRWIGVLFITTGVAFIAKT